MTNNLISEPFLAGGHLQSLLGLVEDMKKKRKKALQVARGEDERHEEKGSGH